MLVTEGKRRVKSIWECDVCKKHFEVENVRARDADKKNQNKFCSKECRLKHQREFGSKRVIDWVKINGSPNFKGGIGITTDGYIQVKIKNRGYLKDQIKLHRYLMEVKLGRRLKPSEIIHHINEDKFDNNIDNLQLLSISEHNKIHRNFCGENRTDMWSEEELADSKRLSAKAFLKIYPTRTKAGFYQKRYRLKGVISDGEKTTVQ